MQSPQQKFGLEGKVALVTGASRGLGMAIALGFAAAGAHVVVASRSLPTLQAAVDEIEAAGGRALAIACDLGQWSAVDRLVDTLYSKLGCCNVLVNNAGIVQQMTPLSQTSEAIFDLFHAVNAKGPMHLAARIAERMGASGGGTIVNVATMGALRPVGQLAMYCSSKAALVALTRSMADEWAPLGVRVNAIAPGPFRTEMLEDLEAQSPGFMEYSQQVTMLKRVAQPDEIIGPALFFASEASSYVTGQTLSVCGGAI